MKPMSLESLPHGYRAVVAGSSGGIGRAVYELLVADPACGEAIGLSRAGTPSIDIEDEFSIENASADIAENGAVHLFFDATGILHERELQPEKTLGALNSKNLEKLFAVNATGPALLIKHFHTLMPRGERSIFATVSARVGSITDNHLGGWYGYRASKAALNMFVKSAAIEIARKRPQALCVALHPGTVETRLSDPFAAARDRYTPRESATAMLSVLNRLGPENTGGFYAYDGTDIPW